MIFHFPNLVCWREIWSNFEQDRDIVLVDSISCWVVSVLCGRPGRYLSGPVVARGFWKNPKHNQFFILAEDCEQISSSRKCVLPYLPSFENFAPLISFLNIIDKDANLIIGIGSPKQNILARNIHERRPDIDIYCLGAAVDLTWRREMNIASGTGFQWVVFTFFDLGRTFTKIGISIREAFSIIKSRDERKKFRDFCLASKKKGILWNGKKISRTEDM